MKSQRTFLLSVVVASLVGWAQAGLQVVPDETLLCVIGGESSNIRVVFSNSTSGYVDTEIRARTFQASSATVVPVGEAAWKRLQVLPGQTVIESASLDFPAVKAETKFIVQWLAGSNVIGKTEALVYPTNLLAELKPLLDGEMLGVLDPNNELKPLLKQNDVKFVDLGQMALEDFSGRLAILGPFRSRAQMPEDAARHCKLLAKNGAAILWLQPPPGPHDPLQPSYYSVPAGTNAIVVVQSVVVAGLAENPPAQQRLVQLCRLALHPEPVVLPGTND